MVKMIQCSMCGILMKSDKYKKCFRCLLKSERNCTTCNKIHYGQYSDCYNCWRVITNI